MLGKNFKKLLALLLALSMVFALCACSSTTDTKDPDDDNNNQNNVDISTVDPSTMTEKEYMLLIETTGIKNTIGGIMEIYGAMGDVDLEGMGGMESEITLRVGDDLMQMLKESLPEGSPDFSALEKITMNNNITLDGSMYRTLMGISVNGTKLGDVEMITDLAAMTMWMGLPGLSEQYIEMQMGSVFGGAVEDTMGPASASGSTSSAAVSNAAPAWMAALPKLLEYLPDAETLEPLLVKYLTIVLENIDDVKRESVQKELDGLKQDVIQMTYTITEEDLVNMLVAVMKAAKDDQELKAVVDELSKGVNEMAAEAGESASVDLWPQFKSFLEEGIGYFEEYDEYAEGNYFLITTTLDSKNAVIGRGIAMYTAGEENFSLTNVKVTEGNAFASELAFTFIAGGSASVGPNGEIHSTTTKATVKMTGEGTIKSGVTDGTYVLSLSGDGTTMDLVTFTLKDATDTSGSLTIDPSADLLQRVFGTQAGAIDLALQIAWGEKSGASTTSLNVLLNDKLMVGLDMSTKKVEGASIKKPTNIVDMNDSAALQQWLENIDLQKVIDRWNTTGLPDIFG